MRHIANTQYRLLAIHILLCFICYSTAQEFIDRGTNIIFTVPDGFNHVKIDEREEVEPIVIKNEFIIIDLKKLPAQQDFQKLATGLGHSAICEVSKYANPIFEIDKIKIKYLAGSTVNCLQFKVKDNYFCLSASAANEHADELENVTDELIRSLKMK